MAWACPGVTSQGVTGKAPRGGGPRGPDHLFLKAPQPIRKSSTRSKYATLVSVALVTGLWCGRAERAIGVGRDSRVEHPGEDRTRSPRLDRAFSLVSTAHERLDETVLAPRRRWVG